jgi:hypothetical protein
MNILIECIVVNFLLTLFVWIGTKDDKMKLKGFYNYPKEIQNRIKTIPEYKNFIPNESIKIINLISSFVFFIIVFIICSILNATTAFWQIFRNSVILGVTLNAYDLLILDFLWFSNAKRTKVAGTEDMEMEYHNLKVHIESFVRGIALTVIGSFLTGAILKYF